MHTPVALSKDRDHLFKLLNDEQWCISYLFSRRWPNGFTCPCCKRMSRVKPSDRKFTCPVCGHSMSITSGTLFHGTKKHLSQWMLALWMLCNRGKVNCRTLQKKLAIKSYHTAWQWRQKLLVILEESNDKKCSGIVETESAAITDSKTAVHTPSILAAKEIGTDPDVTGRLRLSYCPDLSAKAIKQFVEENIARNSMVIVPDRTPYTLLEPGEFRFIPEPGIYYLEHASSLLRQFLENNRCPQHLSTGAERRLRKQLTDFSFQANKKLYPDTITLFEHMVAIALHCRPSVHTDSLKQTELQRGTAC